MTDFQPRQTVYLPNGQEAEYVAMIDGQHAVRIIYDVEGNGYDEPPYSYPDDRVTITHQVFAKAPVERFDAQVLAMQAKHAELAREVAELRNEVSQIERNRKAMQKAAEKYPEIQDALDFVEGRITHVVQRPSYGGVRVLSVKDALEDRDTEFGRVRVNGLKLLCLFGMDTAGKQLWKVNHYRDGSGSVWTTIWPARSEAEARAKVQDLMDVAMASFRAGGEKWWIGHINIADTLEANPWMDVPEDWAAYRAAQEEAQRQEKIVKLRAQLAELESGHD
jgi:hypothetical protein